MEEEDLTAAEVDDYDERQQHQIFHCCWMPTRNKHSGQPATLHRNTSNPQVMLV